MDKTFWDERWRDGRIGFHQDIVTPLLARHWDALQLPEGSRVFVPLAGKTLDMPWLASRGHRVLGVELSRLAIDQFFHEHRLEPNLRETRYGVHFCAGAIEMVCGDVFALDRHMLSDCQGVFDRAALIALPPDTRMRYAGELFGHLPQDCRGLLVTLEYPQQQKSGPPFSVDADEVQALYAPGWALELLERCDILAEQPAFADEGVDRLHTAAWRLHKRG
ncbi:MAG: thiopurine S-methyltransferase [Luteimonas sp.]